YSSKAFSEATAMRQAVRFPVIEMSGSPYEMGLAHGRACRGLIRRLAGKFDGWLLRDEYLEEGKRVAQEAVPCVRAEAPELLEEVRGIADGAGLDFEDVFRLSCATELHSWHGCKLQQAVNTVTEGPVDDLEGADGCTSFTAQYGESSLVAWNMDWWTFWQPYMVLLHGQPTAGPAFLSFAIAGTVGRPGLSEKVAVAANFLSYRRTAKEPLGGAEWGGPGVPYNFMTRMLLAQKSTKDALALLKRVRRMCCLNYTLGDAGGDVCCVETLPGEIAEVRSEEGFVVHANSYHSPKFGGLTEAEQRTADPRAYHAREVVRRRKVVDRETIYAAQRAHFPRTDSGVCVHSKGERPLITLLSFVAEVGKGRMWAAQGSPCEHRFLRYEV
ncbi:MAG: C45 family peptidase, partial [Armatimonadia bacterium]